MESRPIRLKSAPNKTIEQQKALTKHKPRAREEWPYHLLHDGEREVKVAHGESALVGGSLVSSQLSSKWELVGIEQNWGEETAETRMGWNLEADLELRSGDVAGAAGVHAVEPLPEHHRVLHLRPPTLRRGRVGVKASFSPLLF